MTMLLWVVAGLQTINITWYSTTAHPILELMIFDFIGWLVFLTLAIAYTVIDR